MLEELGDGHDVLRDYCSGLETLNTANPDLNPNGVCHTLPGMCMQSMPSLTHVELHGWFQPASSNFHLRLFLASFELSTQRDIGNLVGKLVCNLRQCLH